MSEQAWDAEDRLQALLVKYPNMLAGDQMNQLEPRRWLLVSREFGIPGEIDAAGRWSVDHLFLDQDAIPTLVEVKRSSDTRIRREVVGQMLDYASHLVTNVSAESIRQKYQLAWPDESAAASAMREALGEETDPDAYWQRLNDNIAANKLRLVFVADEFPPELRRIVEFLNRGMQQTDVFAVEVRQFVSPDGLHRTLVPRLLGRVESKHVVPPLARWSRARFDAVLAADHPDLNQTAADLLDFATALMGRAVEWGTGRDRGSFTARLVELGHRLSVFSVYTTGEVSINLGWMKALGEIDPTLSEDMRTRTNTLFGINLNVVSWERGWPMVPLSLVRDHKSDFMDLIKEAVQRIRSSLARLDSAP